MKSKSTNKGLTCGKRKDNSLDPCFTNQFGRGESKPRKEGEKGRDFRERVSTFSLDFQVIGSSNSGETRGKVGPTARAMCGYQFYGVSTTPGGRGFFLLALFFG